MVDRCGARPLPIPGTRNRPPCLRAPHGPEVKHRAYGGREWTDAETDRQEQPA